MAEEMRVIKLYLDTTAWSISPLPLYDIPFSFKRYLETLLGILEWCVNISTHWLILFWSKAIKQIGSELKFECRRIQGDMYFVLIDCVSLGVFANSMAGLYNLG